MKSSWLQARLAVDLCKKCGCAVMFTRWNLNSTFGVTDDKQGEVTSQMIGKESV